MNWAEVLIVTITFVAACFGEYAMVLMLSTGYILGRFF